MIGSVFEGRFTLNGFLAEGPIFTLYSARDKLTAKDVSLRLLKSPFNAEESFREALIKAVDATSMISSPFVERLLNVSTDEGKTYLIGDLTRAPSLSDRIRKLAPFTPPVAVSCAISICKGLDSFHKLNIAHGDVSGDNVAMLGDGETRLQLGGVWFAYSKSATAGILVLPTLAPYLAPEISNGELPDAASDLYAVGILLFELLTGRRPYQAETGLATAMRHSTEPTPHVRSLNPSIPSVLDEIVYKAMAKDAHSRYRTASEFLFDLRQTQDALRFGRNLSWPISQVVPTVAPATKVQVAPRMSAVKEVEKRNEARAKTKPERDVPVWMLLIFLFAAGGVVALVFVNFIIGATSPVLVAVPSLTGLTLPEAKASLQQLHLKAKIGDSVPNDRVDADKIIDSVPATGQKLPENSTIVVNLSLGSREVAVPQLKAMTPDKAREVLATVNLKLDDKIGKANDPSVPEGTICRQTPAVGVKLNRSGTVHVSINDHSDATSTEAKQYQYEIRVSLRDITQSVDVRIEMTDETGTKQIFEEEKQPGDTIQTTAEGTSDRCTFTIYYDDQQVEKDEYFRGKPIKRELKKSEDPTTQP